MKQPNQTAQNTVHHKITRLFMLELIRKFPANLMYRVSKEAVIVYEGENGEDQFDKNWEWMLFTATLKQLEDICNAFEPTKASKEKEEKTSLILDNFGRPIK